MLVMLISMVIAFSWEKVPIIKNTVHVVLDPTAGKLLDWNLTVGMLFVVLFISIIIILLQKYMTDQKTLRELKAENKLLSAEMKNYRDNPEKLMELQKKQFEKMPIMMEASMRPLMYTAIPFILFFRWFHDYFTLLGNPKFFGFLSWFWFYLIASIILTSILRKVMKVA